MTDRTAFVPPWTRINDACHAFIHAYRTDDEDGALVREALDHLRAAVAEDDAAPKITVQELALAIYQGGLASGCHQNTIARKLLARYDITPKRAGAS